MTKAQRTAYNKAYYARNRERLILDVKRWVADNREHVQARNKAHYNANRERLLLDKKEYHKRPEVKARKKAYNAEYRKKNKEALKANRKAYRIANRDKINRKNREYWAKNPEMFNRWKKNWAKKNHSKLLAYDHRRMLHEKNAPTDQQRVEEFYIGVRSQSVVSCTYCGVQMRGEDAHIDHVIPISRGGAHLPENFAVACAFCNHSKSDSLLKEWKRCPEKFKNIGHD